jgi:hypothetical protein
MQSKLFRASLAGPSDRSGVGTRIIAKIFQVPISSPDTMTAHWRQRDIPAGRLSEEVVGIHVLLTR